MHRSLVAFLLVLVAFPLVGGLVGNTLPPAQVAGRPPGLKLILPQNRSAFFTSESVEIGVAGHGQREVVVELVPQKPGALPVRFTIGAGGLANSVALGPLALAPNVYTIKLNGKEAGKLTITTGVPRSTMLVSQSSVRPPEGGANFILGNAFSFGLLDNKGLPQVQVRGKRSTGLNFFEEAVLADLPVIIYMYWTGYVTHKPFGDEKSWSDPEMHAAMRLLNFHTAQRLRRYGQVVRSIGPIDEPGLGWGKTPAGGRASGFPNWVDQPWYEKRDWEYTNDPAARPNADWMKYLTIRCGIIPENYRQARKDVQTVWPEAVWSGDLYAPHAIMDGTDPLNQEVNQVPASHVFFDFFGGPMAATGQIYLEKAHDPLVHIAHAMNGQLTGTHGPQRPLYHVLMNQMLAAGIESNWWLNTGTMTKEDLAAVNGPAERIGPVFREMTPRDHDVALLWSFTEIGQREKAIVAKEAHKKTGAQIKLLLPLPSKGEVKEAEIETSPYEVGGVYLRQVVDVHQVLRRAGYTAHIVHERLLPRGALKKYKTLILVGQTFDFPADVRQALGEFVKAGGKILADKSTTVKLAGAVVYEGDFSAAGTRARAYREQQQSKAAKTKREASLYTSSNYCNKFHRDAVPGFKAALAKTTAQPVFVSDDPDLVGERHAGGEGQLYMILNGHEKYPEVPEGKPLPTYNYAPATATYTLQGIPPGSMVYCLEGLDWKKVSKLEKFDDPITANFAAGEMKLYLVAPRLVQGMSLNVKGQRGAFQVKAQLQGLKMPLPLTVSISAPDGRSLYKVYRATNKEGAYTESFPVGKNASPGAYTVRLVSPIENLTVEVKAPHTPAMLQPTPFKEPARVFDEETIRKFLATKPSVVIPVGKSELKEPAVKLAASLRTLGLKVQVVTESAALRKAVYPRVWDPYARLYKAAGAEKKPDGPVKTEVTLSLLPTGVLSAKTRDGKEVENWRTPNTLVTVGENGVLDWLGPHEFVYEPGCKWYIDAKNQTIVLKGELTHVKTTKEFKAKWSRPWTKLTTHVGGYQLPPELPEAFTTDSHLILLGDSTSSVGVAALQASEILPQVVDARYPGPGRALVSFAWSPFAVEKNVILVGASDRVGLYAGMRRLVELASGQ